jgi:hypothetical protein
MSWEAKPSGARGRQKAYSDAAIQASPDDQSTVGFAFEADGWLCRKSAGIDQAELDSARLSHLVLATEAIAGRHSLSGLTGAVTSAHR